MRAIPDFPSTNGYLGLRHSTSVTLRSTLTPRLVNEFRTGLQAGSGLFGPDVDAGMFSGSLANQDGYALSISDAGITNAHRSTSPSRRNPPYVLFEDTLNWNRGAHSISFGGTFSNTGVWTWSQTVVPSIGFGVDTTFDPARTIFDSVNGPKNFPGASNTQISTARRHLRGADRARHLHRRQRHSEREHQQVCLQRAECHARAPARDGVLRAGLLAVRVRD